MPTNAFAMVAQNGDMYYGLWHPIIACQWAVRQRGRLGAVAPVCARLAGLAIIGA
jgi:hypothetical protein